ncbi:MAG: glycosyltransferase family 2 protein [Prolixibacteraceae bacterium]|jgi:GT2 family glycosyltransferase|nr:glycosyltransferase family 2 protein [Prolixibacteraceae bacterium]
MSKAKTAIVILNWNGEKLLPQFLPSVIEHSRLPNTRIVVADNGSTDASIQILSEKFSEVEILDLKQNHGFAKGYNEALRQIGADYYVILNSDVELSEGWLQPVIKLLDHDETIGAVQPKILSHRDKNKFEYAGAAGGFIDRYGFPFCRGRILNVTENDEGQYDQSIDIFWGSGACLVIRAELFHRAGGFDAGFWAHMEEIDLCWRIKNMGHRVVFCPESRVYHLGGGSLPYNSPRKLYLNFRNNLSLLYKNLPAGKLFGTLFVRMVFDASAAFRLLLEGNVRGFLSVIQAHLSFYRNLPSLQQKRNLQNRFLTPKMHPEMFRKSIILNFYMKGKKRFCELRF